MAGQLSIPRTGMAINSYSNYYAVFAGGLSGGKPSSRVDIWNLVTNSWSTFELSMARYYASVIGANNNLYIAGGKTAVDSNSTRIDIFHLSTRVQTQTELTRERYLASTAAVGNKVLFICGYYNTDSATVWPTNVTDILDVSTMTWKAVAVPGMFQAFSTTVAGNKVYLAGGFDFNSGAVPMQKVMTYDEQRNLWSEIDPLRKPKSNHTGISYGDKIYWAGGELSWQPLQKSCFIEIRNINNQTVTQTNLAEPVSDLKSFVINDKLVFVTERIQNELFLEIYDPLLGNWTKATIPVPAQLQFVIKNSFAVNNKIYLVDEQRGEVYRIDY